VSLSLKSLKSAIKTRFRTDSNCLKRLYALLVQCPVNEYSTQSTPPTPSTPLTGPVQWVNCPLDWVHWRHFANGPIWRLVEHILLGPADKIMFEEYSLLPS
jgi:hypothetical protein